MKTLLLTLIICLLYACTKNKKSDTQKKNQATEIIKPSFQSILDSNKVVGSILIYNPQKNRYYSNDFDWAKTGHLPASTFKIANSLIALETKTVDNDSTLFVWDGKKRAYKSWEQNLILRDAFHFSCVPCFQGIAKQIGTENMNTYLKRLDYPGMVVNTKNISNFWLEGDSKINQFQQIDFLKRFYNAKLPITKRTQKIMERIILIEENDQYKLSGKTGLSIRGGMENGWFVGYLQSKTNTYFFATNIEPKEAMDKKLFPATRKDITLKALQNIKAIIR